MSESELSDHSYYSKDSKHSDYSKDSDYSRDYDYSKQSNYSKDSDYSKQSNYSKDSKQSNHCCHHSPCKHNDDIANIKSRHNNRYKKIIVFILTPDPYCRNTQNLENLFTDDVFVVKSVNIPSPLGITGTSNITVSQAVEAYRVNKVLKRSAKYYPECSVLIIKDNCVTVASKKSIAKICKSIDMEKGWDICYLGKWLDRCDLYRDVKKIKGESSIIVRTMSPHGIQAFMFSTKGRDILLGKRSMKNGHMFPVLTTPLDTELNKQIEKGNIYALCTNPNIFIFDVSKCENVCDLAKLSECRRPDNNGDNEPAALPFIWFLAIVIGTLLLAWALWFIGPHGKRLYQGKIREE